MKQFDVVEVIRVCPMEGLIKGIIGTILEVYNDNHFEVEI
ncbi:DUF4926 domain-containing protein [Neobacillus niacini]